MRGFLMPKTRVQKEQDLNVIKDSLRSAKAVVFADYKGMNMQQFNELRDKLREQGAQFTVTKNTLTRIALKEIGKVGVDDFEGPTATLIAFEDEISPIKILVKALKDFEKGQIKAGFLGEDFLDEATIKKLASLPSKEELRGKTVSVLVAPLQGIVGVLQANLRNLVYALSEIQRSKGGV